MVKTVKGHGVLAKASMAETVGWTCGKLHGVFDMSFSWDEGDVPDTSLIANDWVTAGHLNWGKPRHGAECTVWPM